MSIKSMKSLSVASVLTVVTIAGQAWAGDVSQSQKTETISAVENIGYTPITHAAIDDVIAASVTQGMYDETLTRKYDEGVAVAFREAYATNVLTALWNEHSAKALLNDLKTLENNGYNVFQLKEDTRKATELRFKGDTAALRANGDMILSAIYIDMESLRSPQTSDLPRLANLDNKLLIMAKSGEMRTSDYMMHFRTQ